MLLIIKAKKLDSFVFKNSTNQSIDIYVLKYMLWIFIFLSETKMLGICATALLSSHYATILHTYRTIPEFRVSMK